MAKKNQEQTKLMQMLLEQGLDPSKGYDIDMGGGNIVKYTGQNVKQDKGFLGNLLDGIVQPFNRYGSSLGEITEKRKLREGGGDLSTYTPKFMSKEDYENYQNPFNQVKDLASIGANFLPGAGGLKAAVGTGLAAGFGSSYGNDDIGGTISDTLMGGLGGGVTHGVLKGGSKILGGLGKVTGLNPGAKLATEAVEEGATKPGFFKKFANGLEDSGIESKMGKGPGSFTKSIDDEKIIGEALRKRGIFDPNQAKALDKLQPVLGGELDNAYTAHSKQFGKVFSTNEIPGDIDLNIAKRAAFEKYPKLYQSDEQGAIKKLLEDARDELNSYGTKAKGFKNVLNSEGKMDAKELWKYVQDNSAPIKKLNAGKDLTANDEFRLALYDSAKGRLANEPSLEAISGLNREYSALMNTYDATALGRRQGAKTRLPFFGSGIGNEANVGLPIANAATSTKRGIGRFLNNMAGDGTATKSGSKLGNVLRSGVDLTGTLTSPVRSILRSPKARGLIGNQLANPGEFDSMSMPEDIQSMYDGGMGNQMSIQSDPMQDQRMIVEELLSRGMKLSDIKTYMDLTGLGTGGSDDLDTAARKQLRDAQSSMQQLSRLRGDLANGSGTGPIMGRISSLNPFDSDRQALESNSKLVAKTLAAAIEGRSPTDADMRYYEKYLPSTTDSKATADKKINKLMLMLQDQMDIIQGG